MSQASQSLLQLETSISPNSGVLSYVPLLRDQYNKLAYEFPFGYGNYDVNVLTHILQQKGAHNASISDDTYANRFTLRVHYELDRQCRSKVHNG